MLEIITAFWHGENLVLDPESPQGLKLIYTKGGVKSVYSLVWCDFFHGFQGNLNSS